MLIIINPFKYKSVDSSQITLLKICCTSRVGGAGQVCLLVADLGGDDGYQDS
jgi:hypothetical protein